MLRVSPRSSFSDVPIITSESSLLTLSFTNLDTSLNSLIVNVSLDAEMFISTADAPSTVVSRSGLIIASSAACSALFSPCAFPIPICAMPLFDIVVLTSAKSTFIIPGTFIMSVIPLTPCLRT